MSMSKDRKRLLLLSKSTNTEKKRGSIICNSDDINMLLRIAELYILFMILKQQNGFGDNIKK
jgi:hypothetical protein